MTTLRLALAVALLPALTACTATVPIEVTRDVALLSPGGTFDATQVVDLTTIPDVWSRRDRVDAVSIDDVTATVLSVGAGHEAASVTLAIAFRPDGAPDDGSQDLQVGTIRDLPFVAGRAATLHGSGALDDFLLQALKGSGRFTVVVTATLTGVSNASLEVSLRGSAAYALVGK